MFQTKVAHKNKIHILCSITFPEYDAVYVILYVTEESDRAQMAI